MALTFLPLPLPQRKMAEAVFARRQNKRVPVTILTGFLGSGKTTLLNHILDDPNHKLRFAIIENEFGEVGVDEKILSERTNEELIEVINGCICCTVPYPSTAGHRRFFSPSWSLSPAHACHHRLSSILVKSCSLFFSVSLSRALSVSLSLSLCLSFALSVALSPGPCFQALLSFAPPWRQPRVDWIF